MEELDPIKLKEELDQFKKEKEKIRQLMGQIGGKDAEKQDRMVNRFFILAIAMLAANDFINHLLHIKDPLIPPLFSLEIAVLLVSIKIIWMMHKSTKVEHFQFWILNSIEYRLNDVAKQLRHLEKTVEKYHTAEEEETSPEES
jgi:cell shape-determining protein MreC